MPSRSWGIADLVEIRRITSTAIGESPSDVAFIVKQSFIDSDEIRYGLYLTTPTKGQSRKILESWYLADVAAHPNTHMWTVRADVGDGIQLYDVDSTGRMSPLVVKSQTMPAGAAESMVAVGADQGPMSIGIRSYQWAPDGRSLWYSTYRLRNVEERTDMMRNGLVYDDQKMNIHAFFGDPTMLLGVELHVLGLSDHSDRIVVFIPGGPTVGLFFNREDGSASWLADSRHIRYLSWESTPNGVADMATWSVDAFTGIGRRLPEVSGHDSFHSVQLPDGSGYLTVKRLHDGRHLLQLRETGEVLRDLGKVSFDEINEQVGFLGRPDRRSIRLVLGVRYSDREGLAQLIGPAVDQTLSRVHDNLSNCSFSKNVDFGVCVSESLTRAPELVEVHPSAGTVTALAQVNPGFLELKPLRFEVAHWTNRYGNSNDGYVTYPRSFEKGRAYPTIVITHGRDAINRFASPGFQWEFPIQVLAEEGYLVLSVNEPADTRSEPVLNSATPENSSPGIQEIQFSEAFNSISSMESAVGWAIEEGMAEPEKTGIAGYSRGAEVTEWTMTQSKLFHVAIEGDAGGYPAAHYGFESPPQRAYFRHLFGGTPFDPDAMGGYGRLSVSFRYKEFAGPLLQLFANANGPYGMELHALLRDAGTPADLVVFPSESHVFWNPRHQASAMQRSIEWFDYWLLDRRNPDPDKVGQYSRWDAMAGEWKSKQGRMSP